jgi:hypothetical protein
MTRLFASSEDALRELRSPVMPVDDPEVALARRRRTVSHLQALQARSIVRRQIAGSWRKRLLVAALVFFPAVALAATWVVLRAPFVEHSNGGGAPFHRAASTENQAPPPVDGTLSVSHATLRENGRGASDSTQDGQVDAVPSSQPSPKAVARTLRVSRTHGATRGGVQGSDASTLAAENALMQAAMAAARTGDDARAVSLFGDLLARYPRSPLAYNAGVARFRALRRLGDERAASSR